MQRARLAKQAAEKKRQEAEPVILEEGDELPSKRHQSVTLTNEQIDANVERIVARAQAAPGEVKGANVEKTFMAVGRSLRVHKLG